jgi:hypothetical protein
MDRLTKELLGLMAELATATDVAVIDAIIAKARELRLWVRAGVPPWEND